MMTGRTLAQLSLVAIVAATSWTLGVPAAAPTASAAVFIEDEPQTQDIIHMNDGRVLTGEIVSEDGDTIVFKYVDPNIRIQSQLTLYKSDILAIERDVAVKEEEPDPVAVDAEEFETVVQQRERGMAEGNVEDASLPALYVIPMVGQMGTDIRLEVYTDIIDDIKRKKPEVVVWRLECTDIKDEILGEFEYMIDRRQQEEQGLFFLIDDYRVLVQKLHDELRGIRQVMWVHDAYGVGSVMALAWPEMYMTPGARLVGMSVFFQEHGGDADIKAKMREAWIGTGNGFLMRGGHAPELGYGLMNPRTVLSATWRGRKVIWRNDLDGEVVVNNSRNNVAWFRAKTAEDFGISKGTVETLDDLALLLGYREYRVMEGDGRNTIVRYKQNWRREFDQAWKRFLDYNQHMRWVNGDQALMWLGRAKSDLEYIVSAMRRFPAVELRLRFRGLPDRLSIEMRIEQLGQQIAAMRRGGRGGRGGGGGGAGGGRG